MICRFDIETTEPEWALGYRFDIVLRGRERDALRGTATMSETDIGEVGLHKRSRWASRPRRPSARSSPSP